jgi:hypothetical protein
VVRRVGGIQATSCRASGRGALSDIVRAVFGSCPEVPVLAAVLSSLLFYVGDTGIAEAHEIDSGRHYGERTEMGTPPSSETRTRWSGAELANRCDAFASDAAKARCRVVAGDRSFDARAAKLCLEGAQREPGQAPR